MSEQTNQALHALAHEVALDIVSQPTLFPAESVPGAHLLPGGVLHRRPSGKILAKDEPRCLLVGALRELGLSDRRISSLTGVSREAIGPILQELERRGKIRPLKERLAGAMGLLAEESTQAAREMVQALRDGDRSEGVTMALRALGPMVGIAAEKTQLLTGGATEIVETRAGRSETDEAEFLRRVRAGSVEVEAVTVAPADSESDGQPRNPLLRNAAACGDTVGDTAAAAQVPAAGAGACDGAGGGSTGVGGSLTTLV